ncbi:hypothetical protein ACHAW6_000206 [Cyclotella cf. meneghiniana]
MLLYLSEHSHPDITYAVNCCVQYMFTPCLSHKKALKRIGRYLKVTWKKGLILNPCVELKVDAFPDAYFTGLYAYAKNTCPEVIKSRIGFFDHSVQLTCGLGLEVRNQDCPVNDSG